MYNRFLHRQLILISTVLSILLVPAYGQENDLYVKRDLDLNRSVHEELYHHAIQSISAEDHIIDAQQIDKQEVLSLLYTNYPELAYEL